MAKKNLFAAKLDKRDEFYTQLCDIERELWKSHATLTLLAKQDSPFWLQYD